MLLLGVLLHLPDLQLRLRLTLPHTRIDTAFSPGIYPRHGCSLWIYPPTHWVYTRISPFALVIYEDNTHIKPSIGHSINTGTHMCICGSACHSWFLALTNTDNCFPLTASGGRSKKIPQHRFTSH